MYKRIRSRRKQKPTQNEGGGDFIRTARTCSHRCFSPKSPALPRRRRSPVSALSGKPLAMVLQGKKTISNAGDVFTEFMEGLVDTYPGLQNLDGFPQIKDVLPSVFLHGTYDKGAVISGGGSCHEAGHDGFVGPGILTSATSGSVDSFLAAIRVITCPRGCLLIVKNYTGDRLNFAEQAKSEGFKMVISADDCALPPPQGIAGRRGLVGTIFVHKVGVAAAVAGLSLADVAAEAKNASEVIGTMGVALFVCTLPGKVVSDRLGPDHMAIGLGIHGEPCLAVVDLQPVDIVEEHVLNQFLSQETQYLPITMGSNVVLLINGLGATPIMEHINAARKAVPELKLECGIAVDRVSTGTLMSSLGNRMGNLPSFRKAENLTIQGMQYTKGTTCAFGSILCIHSKPTLYGWRLDSGATNHVCGKIDA